MSDPDGRVPSPSADLSAEDSPLNRSAAAGEFAPSLPDTFAAWLAELKPAFDQQKELVSAQPAAEDAPLPGEFRFEGTLRVDGSAAGQLRSLTGTLILGEAADVDSNVVVATAIIDGSLHGDIHATERVELQSHAKVFGNIESPALAIQPGAVFEGQCRFLPSPAKSGKSDQQESDQPQEFPLKPSGEEADAADPFAAVAAAG